MQQASRSVCARRALSARTPRGARAVGLLFALCASALGCGGGSGDDAKSNPPAVDVPNPLTDPSSGPAAGNAMGGCDVPADAGLADVSQPKTVVGEGSPESCTAQAFVDAVAAGGVITFDCGKQPLTITLTEPARRAAA